MIVLWSSDIREQKGAACFAGHPANTLPLAISLVTLGLQVDGTTRKARCHQDAGLFSFGLERRSK